MNTQSDAERILSHCYYKIETWKYPCKIIGPFVADMPVMPGLDIRAPNDLLGRKGRFMPWQKTNFSHVAPYLLFDSS
jgi:hypothetical protein